jgi:type II pantothenate kinase
MATALPRSCFGLDIGGTLCKISYFEKYCHSGEDVKDIEFREKVKKLITSQEPYGETGKRDTELEFNDDVLGGKVYLMRFESRKMEPFLRMVKDSTVIDEHSIVCCTGGGSRKYAALFKEVLGLTIRKADELGCLVDGINFTLQRRMKELYRVDHETYM